MQPPDSLTRLPGTRASRPHPKLRGDRQPCDGLPRSGPQQRFGQGQIVLGRDLEIQRVAGNDAYRPAQPFDESCVVGRGDALFLRRPGALSGGQQQRVGVARALAAEPRVMLLDEPFGALDPVTRERLQQSFLRIREKLALTTVFVTHDMTEALTLADRIAVLRGGRLLQVGTPRDLLTRPADDYVDRLMSTPRRQAAAVDALLAGAPA